jgi:histidine ammonia-lyase
MKKTDSIILNHAEKKVTIDGNNLTLVAMDYVANENYKVAIAERSKEQIKINRNFLENKIKSGETIYGLNTGFGFLSNKKIDQDKLEELQENLIRSHAVGVGDFLTIEETRAIMLLRANALAKGFSGIRLEVVERIVELLNKEVHPLIPSKGSVGASGDLAPLSHMALVLIGEGEAIYKGKTLSGKDAIKAAKIKPVKLQAKEGLALINGTPVTTGICAMNYIKAEDLLNIGDLTGAMTLEALQGSHKAFSKELHDARPHPGQVQTAKNLRGLLAGSEIMRSHERCDRVQDAYSLRCIPQVHGAIRDVLAYTKGVLEIELNSSTDNPLIFDKTGNVFSGGNFHAEPIAFVADFLGIAINELASISERRIDKLMNPVLSGLPAFLSKDSGLNSGLMIVQVSAAALVSENKVLASPASVDSIPTSADKEDHVSAGTFAAVKLTQILNTTRDVLALEILCAFQGLCLNLPLKPSIAVKRAFDIIRKDVEPIEKDRAFYEDLRRLQEIIDSNELLSHIRHRKEN